MRLRTGLVGLLVAGSLAVGGTAMAADVTVTVDLTGPEGQVNHGQVVSNFVRALKLQLNEAGARVESAAWSEWSPNPATEREPSNGTPPQTVWF